MRERTHLLAQAYRRLRESSPGRLFTPVGLLLGVVVYGLLGYTLIGLSFTDALALTWSDLTPVDAGPVPDVLVPRFFRLSVSTLGLLALLAIILTALSIANEGGFAFWSRRRRMEEKIERLEDHCVICAYGRVGQATARELEVEGVPFVVIDTKENLEALMRKDGILYIIGDPTSEEVLRRARLDRARGIVCAVDSDATNVYVTLTARSLNPDIYIVARASGGDSPERLYRAGANRVISPYMASGRQMAFLVMRPRVVDSIEVLGRRLEELEIEEGSPLIGLTIEEACHEATPLLVHRADGTTVTNPSPDVLVQGGDRILAWGEAADLRDVESPT
ncbi:MAG: NAD(P)-binding protein [Actinomycetota bacterium]